MRNDAPTERNISSVLTKEMKKNNKTLNLMATGAVALICLFLFLYSRSHWPAEYRPSGYRITPISDVFGAAFLFLLVRFLFVLRGR